MANKLFDHVGGMITVRLLGKRQEKIINMALSRGIYLWDVKKDQESVHFKIRSSAYEALKSLTDENQYYLEVVNQKGLPFLKNTIKRRMGFLVGFAGFIIALYIMSSFIWFIDVSGNQQIDKSKILLVAAKHGVYKGAAKWNFSRNAVEEAMLKDIDQLTYVKINIQGVKADIQVVEKILPGKEITGPCHIVAGKDGIVEEILVLDGQAAVDKGDVVAKGDVLISGIVIPQPSPYDFSEEEKDVTPYLVRARGVIKARVWYEGYGECKMREEKTVLTGRESRTVGLITPWREFHIYSSNQEKYIVSQEKGNDKIVNTPLGRFGFTWVVKKEQKVEKKELTEQAATRIAKEIAMNSLYSKIKKSDEISDSRVEVLSSPSESILRIRVLVETVENIAVAEPINNGGNGN